MIWEAGSSKCPYLKSHTGLSQFTHSSYAGGVIVSVDNRFHTIYVACWLGETAEVTALRWRHVLSEPTATQDSFYMLLCGCRAVWKQWINMNAGFPFLIVWFNFFEPIYLKIVFEYTTMFVLVHIEGN